MARLKELYDKEIKSALKRNFENKKIIWQSLS